nr:4'-phosphopantetheinyl transferase superfamily protein [Micromonospora sp. NBRC 107566]
MLAGLVPPGTVAVESFGDTADAFLYPEEEACIARAVDKRRREFTSARVCARAALAQLGIPPAPILPGPRGAPAWPAGVVGSMTHCDGYRAAAVALGRDVCTIGIDAEPAGPLPDGVLEAIALDPERASVSGLSAAVPGVPWDRLLFSAKEAVYKAWFPLTGAWLDFHQARIDIDPAAHTFTATLLVPGPVAGGTRLSGFAGRWLHRDGLVATAIVQRQPID